ncbi:hypothetical protein DEO72_LG5g2796 [Vigna unguiculata]|uniref:Uncharacterized protein n=1 Tax=Vigna unguiculata TaxID=3917 RepID=A0A4D6M2C3_VIGUN|nr:hypothetical protein DEO72_LG5g2796 [Vigna unguiculata]
MREEPNLSIYGKEKSPQLDDGGMDFHLVTMEVAEVEATGLLDSSFLGFLLFLVS